MFVRIEPGELNLLIVKNKRKSKLENKNVVRYSLSKLDSIEEKVELLRKYYAEYKITGFNGIVKKFNYPHSRIALYKAFKKYISAEFQK